MRNHPTHKTRFSDSSLYDEICIYCKAADVRGSNLLEQPCPEAPKEPINEMDPTRTAFLKAIEEDRYDESTRRIFSDWLEENGYDDEALVQRKWTKEKQEAEDWLRVFSDSIGETCTNYGVNRPSDKYRKITYEEVIQIGYNFLRDGEYFTQTGDDTARNMMYEIETLDLFWKHWSTVTECDTQDNMKSPFSCSC